MLRLAVNPRFSNYLTCALDLFEDRLALVNVVCLQPRFDAFRDFHDSRAPRSAKTIVRRFLEIATSR